MSGLNHYGEEMGQSLEQIRWDAAQRRKKVVTRLLLILGILFLIFCFFDEGLPWPF